MKLKPTQLHSVKQLLQTDSIEAANTLLESGAWILVNTYSQRGWLYYVLGRISEYE